MAALLSLFSGSNGIGIGGSNQSTTGSTNTTQAAAGDSSTQKTLLPQQAQLLDPISSLIQNLLKNPSQFTAPFQAGARNQVNSNYTGLADSLRQQFMGSTGGGGTGKFGMALAQGNLQRLGDLSNVDTAFNETTAQLPLQGVNLANNLLSQNFGTTSNFNTNTTGTQDTSSKTSGTSWHL